jgi:subtilase family serine protease
MRLRLSWRTVAVIGAGALVLPSLGSASFASNSRVTVAGSMPDWARSAHATGNASASATLDVSVVLPLRGGDAAAQLAASVSNPKAESYGAYLSPAQFNAKFAPTAASVSKVQSYLTGKGLKVTEVAAGNRWVSVSGTVKQLDAAFGVTLKNYTYKGKSKIAPSGNATLPASIAPFVTAVTGLDEVSLVHTTDHIIATPLSSATGKAAVSKVQGVSPAVNPPSTKECSVYWGQHRQKVPLAYGKTSLPTYNCGYTPQQIQSAYGMTDAVKGGDVGKGVTVAIIDAYKNPSLKSDTNTWSSTVGVPTLKSGQLSTKGSASSFNDQDECGGADGWYEEAALDVEAVHGMAPGANIQFLGSKNCDDGIDDSINYVVQHHSADMVSNSYGDEGEKGLGSELTLEHSLFLQAAVEGIGFYFSSGDDGDDTDDPAVKSPQADYPSTDPMVTAVGGTSLGVNKDGSKLFENVWGTAIDPIDFPTHGHSHYDQPLPGFFDGGGGGGVSTKFAQPFYQKNIVPKSLSEMNGKTPMRTTPDVSLDADPYTGYFILVTVEGSLLGGAIGGTSMSCPLITGLQAVASQGRPVAIGFANPLMYNLSSIEFNDVKNPASPRAVTNPDGTYVSSFGFDSSLTAVKGYDDGTGLGSPNGILFLVGEAL